MPSIATLTLNPAIDGACDAQAIQPVHKIRTSRERYNPGGGGINVARVSKRLGGEVLAVYLAGGMTGPLLNALVDDCALPRLCVDIADHTRISLAVHEAGTGREYRFVPEGPVIAETEWQAGLAILGQIDCDWLVLSGSLPRGVPEYFYVRAGDAARRRGARVILDTSGTPLARTLEAGGLFLVKPSLGELEQLVGASLGNPKVLMEAAQSLWMKGGAEHLVVTMGRQGAVLVNADGILRLPAISVPVKSTVGAGDSFLGGMTQGLASGQTVPEAFRLGLAAGTAAVMAPGNDLCHREDVERLLSEIADE